MNDALFGKLDFVGDPDALPDAFFDSLANLLLSIDAVDPDSAIRSRSWRANGLAGSMPDVDQVESGRSMTLVDISTMPVADTLRHTGRLLTAGNTQELLP